MKYKTLLVEKLIKCPNCGWDLIKGDILFRDDYRGETVCGYCREDYEQAVIEEEGENGELLR